MAAVTAENRDGWIFVYDENGQEIWNKYIDKIASVTCSSGYVVVTDQNNCVITYDERGNRISSRQR
ncbi:hypothetical protein [Helicobacter sp. 11S02596-1]|uniref:hypothetical protein n=1 Tax=Helicobacter sp. 11S02596-1 TaxID=1476194 RepID=UPI000BA524EF|nr:hypothetical protein [Helicobacter sp. 11S02596-1]PAF41406.1 hypothetical protein BJI48_08560 [Helicobacter sp. 11S02596-1]